MIQNLCEFIPSILKNLELYAKIDHMNKRLQLQHSQLLNELKLARKIQQNLIPAKLPQIEGIHLASFYKPMEAIGGDFYDLIKIREPNLFGIFISDVSGHGVPAALITSMVKTLIETAGGNRIRPAGLLNYINDKISGQTGGNFITAFYGIYDKNTRLFSYARGAHNPPYLIRNKKIRLLESKGKLLGLTDHLEFEEKSIQLQSGDRILFYTDGLTEAENSNNQEFDDILRDFLIENSNSPAQEFSDMLYHALLKHREGFQFDDDVCALVMDIE